MIGQTISHYRILEKLGEGGMGVVYKAHDLKLDRDVALKFLPHHLSATGDEQARFLQEARAASALNHPNVCVIHDIQEHEGQQFIIMEFVDGKTLRQLIPSQRTQIAIDYAILIGEALQEAHSKGIVHRDIKADNIMVNSKNQIKVMDFGLAKLKGSLKLTKTSSTVGTLAYMAPEQIQGGEVDARSDIFSFGVVLYEMLTGHTPFRGEHEAAMVYSIVNEEPTPVQKYLPDVSSELVHILNRALEKDPEDRYQSVHDMVIDLRRLKKQTSRVSRTFDSIPSNGARQAAKLKTRKIAIVSVGSTVVLAAVLILILGKPAVRLNSNMTTKQLDIPFTQIGYPGLSPDGKWLAFPAADANGKWDIYNMHVTGGQPTRITFDSSQLGVGQRADISPDGSHITYAFYNPKTGLYEIRVAPSLGGVSTVVSKMGGNSKWRPDGKRIGFGRYPDAAVAFAPSASGSKEFWTVAPNGTDERLEFVDSLGRPEMTMSFSWSPDGRSIAWLRTFGDLSQEIVLRELATGKELQLTHEGNNIDEVWWTSNDHIIYSSSKGGSITLWMILAAGGESVQITKEGPDMGMTVSADCGRMVYYRKRVTSYIWRANTDGSNPKQLTFEGRRVDAVKISPDRKRILFCGGNDEFGMKRGIYVVDRDGNGRREVVPVDQQVWGAFWSPDGRWLSYSTQEPNVPIDSSRILLMDANTLSTPRQIARGICSRWVDARTLLVRRRMRRFQLDIETLAERTFFRDSTLALPAAGGQYIWYRDLRPATSGLWIVPANDKDGISTIPKLMLADTELFSCVLSEDGSFALLWDDQGTLWKMSLPSGRRERLPHKLPGLKRSTAMSISYDGKEVVYVQSRLDTKLMLVENLFE